MAIHQLNDSVEMYLKVLLEMGNTEPVLIPRLAERLAVTTVSANEMIHKLVEMEFISYIPYKGARLTEKGRDLACSVIRRQRLWEVFLANHLKIEWALVYELACTLEHATAPEVTQSLDDFLGYPKICPHGKLIPSADGSFAPLDGTLLSEMPTDSHVQIKAINATDTTVLKYLKNCNLLPGQELTIPTAAPLQGPLTLLVGENLVSIGLQMAELILVQESG